MEDVPGGQVDLPLARLHFIGGLEIGPEPFADHLLPVELVVLEKGREPVGKLPHAFFKVRKSLARPDGPLHVGQKWGDFLPANVEAFQNAQHRDAPEGEGEHVGLFLVFVQNLQKPPQAGFQVLEIDVHRNAVSFRQPQLNPFLQVGVGNDHQRRVEYPSTAFLLEAKHVAQLFRQRLQ